MSPTLHPFLIRFVFNREEFWPGNFIESTVFIIVSWGWEAHPEGLQSKSFPQNAAAHKFKGQCCLRRSFTQCLITRPPLWPEFCSPQRKHRNRLLLWFFREVCIKVTAFLSPFAMSEHFFLLTYLVNGVVAVFFVNEGIKNVVIIIHLPLPLYPPPV